MNPTLIIPSAKLVPEELQKVGKFPGVIYPVNQKIVFDYLYEQYKNVCKAVSYTHLRAHETDSYLVCRLLLEKKKKSMPI